MLACTAPLREQGPATAAPLSAKRPLERARVSPWKSYGRARIVVLMDGGGGDQADDVLAFHRVHGDNEKTLQDARTSSTSWTGRTFVVICACVMEGGGGALGGPGGAGWAWRPCSRASAPRQ